MISFPYCRQNCGFDVWKEGSAFLAPGLPELGIVLLDSRSSRALSAATASKTPWGTVARSRPGSGVASSSVDAVHNLSAAVDAMGHASARVR